MKLYCLEDSYCLKNHKYVRVFSNGYDTLYVVESQKLIQVRRTEPKNNEKTFHTNYMRTVTCFPVALFYQKLNRKKDYFPDIKDEAVCFCHYNVMLIGTYDEVFYDTITRIHKDRNYENWGVVNV